MYLESNRKEIAKWREADISSTMLMNVTSDWSKHQVFVNSEILAFLWWIHDTDECYINWSKHQVFFLFRDSLLCWIHDTFITQLWMIANEEFHLANPYLVGNWLSMLLVLSAIPGDGEFCCHEQGFFEYFQTIAGIPYQS